MTFKIPQEEALLGERELRNVKFKKQNEGYASSTQADQGSVIEFIPMHFKNTPVISFVAFLDGIKDRVAQDFTPNQPYGRMDPIQVWKSSSRVITFNFKIVSFKLLISLLISFLKISIIDFVILYDNCSKTTIICEFSEFSFVI